MADDIQRLILDEIRALDSKLDAVTVDVARVATKVDEHAVAQTREHAEVQRRVGILEAETKALGKASAGMKVKLTLIGAAVGGTVAEAFRRLFHT